MQDPLPIVPFDKPLNGSVDLPGSKSITCRAMFLAALTSSTIILKNALISEDTLILAKVLEDLGFFVSVNPHQKTIAIEGHGGTIPNDQASLYVGNSGITARFLPAFLSLHPSGTYHIHGAPPMKRRPLLPLLSALEAINAVSVTYHEAQGHIPCTLKTQGIPGGSVTIEVSQTSQVLSSLLLVAPLAYSPLTIHITGERISSPFVIMTLRMMEAFGQGLLPVEHNSAYHFSHLQSYHYTSSEYLIEPDATAASYFLALLIIAGGTLTFPHLSLLETLQGDALFSEVMKSLGLQFENTPTGTTAYYAPSNNRHEGLQVDFSAISDTFPTLAAIAPLLNSPTEIYGIGHTRLKESNRVAAVATELTKLGQHVVEEEDKITIEPHLPSPATIDTYDDHRIAMAFAILGCHDLHKNTTPWIHIKNPTTCSKSFPNFFQILESLRS